MIHVENHGPVIAIRMSRSLFGRPICWTAAYWIDGLLIDTGPSCTAHELVTILEQVHVDQIVITHGHEDHIGGLALLHKHYPNATIYASRRTVPLLAQPQRLNLHLYRRILWGTPEAVEDICTFDSVDNVIETGDYAFRMVETPGYTADHVSFFEASRRWLFCGDAFSAGRDNMWMNESDLFGVVCSLRTLASLRPERLFPGSGNVRRTPQPEIHQKIRYLTNLSQTVAKLEATSLTNPEMVACMFQEEPRLAFWTGGHISAANLIEACKAYNDLIYPQAQPPLDAQHSGRPQTDSPSGSSRSTWGHAPNSGPIGNS